MMIIGCDFHTRYQQIAMMDEATGELTERRLEHQSGEAQAFYRNLQGPVRVGIEATGPLRWFERLLTELGHELWIGDPAEDSRQRSAQAKDRRTRCFADSRSAAGETLSENLGSHTGGTRPAAVALASSQAGVHAHDVGQPVARAGPERRTLPEEKVVHQERPRGTAGCGHFDPIFSAV